MAKMKRFPKAPKAGAGLKTLQEYEKKCKAVKTHNDAIDRDKKAKQAIRDRAAKMKSK